jgi:hypothetical protein
MVLFIEVPPKNVEELPVGANAPNQAEFRVVGCSLTASREEVISKGKAL